MKQKFINFRQERNFESLLNVVFIFLYQNFFPLFKILSIVVTPIALFAGLILGLFQTKILSHFTTNAILYPEHIYIGLIGVFLVPISLLLVCLITFSYIYLYNNRVEKITVKMVLKITFDKILFSVFASILLTVITILGFSFIIPGIYMAVAFQFALIIIVNEKVNIFTLIKRCFEIIKGNWFKTFALLAIVSLFQILTSIIFYYPAYIVTTALTIGIVVSKLNLIFYIITLIIGTISISLMFVISALTIGFQYFNLIERQENIKLSNNKFTN